MGRGEADSVYTDDAWCLGAVRLMDSVPQLSNSIISSVQRIQWAFFAAFYIPPDANSENAQQELYKIICMCIGIHV